MKILKLLNSIYLPIIFIFFFIVLNTKAENDLSIYGTLKIIKLKKFNQILTKIF